MGNMHCISDRRYPFRLDWNSGRISGRVHRDAIKLSNRREGTRAFRGRHIQVRITDQIPPRLRLGRLTPRRFRGYKCLRLSWATGAVKSHVSRISVATLLEDFSCRSTRAADFRVRVGVGARPGGPLDDFQSCKANTYQGTFNELGRLNHQTFETLRLRRGDPWK